MNTFKYTHQRQTHGSNELKYEVVERQNNITARILREPFTGLNFKNRKYDRI